MYVLFVCMYFTQYICIQFYIWNETQQNLLCFTLLYFLYKCGSILWAIAPCSPLKANRPASRLVLKLEATCSSETLGFQLTARRCNQNIDLFMNSTSLILGPSH
jgi:hypothetical protein